MSAEVRIPSESRNLLTITSYLMTDKFWRDCCWLGTPHASPETPANSSTLYIKHSVLIVPLLLDILRASLVCQENDLGCISTRRGLL